MSLIVQWDGDALARVLAAAQRLRGADAALAQATARANAAVYRAILPALAAQVGLPPSKLRQNAQIVQHANGVSGDVKVTRFAIVKVTHP